MYRIPGEYFFRIHHIRPRFKNDVENVLIYMATKLSELPEMEKNEFKKEINKSIRLFPGNENKTLKTINNWRTEISALFGLIEQDSILRIYKPSGLANKLADNQDLVQFFKYFLFYFQYPGGHLKAHEAVKFIQEGILFKPAKYILSVLEAGEKSTGKRFYITKAEATHCIFNDLRVTKFNRTPEDTLDLILANRDLDVDYDWTGDVIRYAGDIIDYMVIADLLKTYDSHKFYLNNEQKEVIGAFVQSDVVFEPYLSLYNSRNLGVRVVAELNDEWFSFVNQDLGEDLFKTDLFQYLGIEEESYEDIINEALENFKRQVGEEEGIRTKEIGDFGEGLILGHEKMRVRNGDREDLIHLIQKIPTQFAVGYDVQSVELDATKRYIEVKTTISNKKINFFSFHLTTNEWNTASSLKERYYVYRLAISKQGTELFLINDPVGQYKADKLLMIPRDGVDIRFREENSQKEDLLIWKR